MDIVEVTTLEEVTAKNPDFALFTGEKVNGTSWCPDCVVAEPVIMAEIKKAQYAGKTLAICSISRDIWKSPENPYKKERTLRLSSVPTLCVWKQNKIRLAESQLTNADDVADLLDQ